MTNLSPLEAHVLAYYLANSAKDFNMSGRWFPYGELERIFADKMRVDVRPFGKAAQEAAAAAGVAYLDHMIANGGFASKPQKFGGTMHQYTDGYRVALDALKAADPILAQAADGGAEFWQSAFADLA